MVKKNYTKRFTSPMFRAGLHHVLRLRLAPHGLATFAGTHIPRLAFSKRSLSNSTRQYASLFGEVTLAPTPQAAETNGAGDEDLALLTPKDDADLQKHYLKEAQEKQLTREKFVSDIKRTLFDANVAANGFFKNNQIVRDPATGKLYKLSLTPEEIDLLEPTIYIQSYRIKSSMKKATVVNRFARRMNVKNAINQLHFNPKKMSTELEKLLKRGLEQARELGYDENGLYIQALWTGSDGEWGKRHDVKGRGRTGIIHHPFVHLKTILKTDQTKQRLAWEKEQARLVAKPRSFLNNEPLNFSVRGLYKW